MGRDHKRAIILIDSIPKEKFKKLSGSNSVFLSKEIYEKCFDEVIGMSENRKFAILRILKTYQILSLSFTKEDIFGWRFDSEQYAQFKKTFENEAVGK